MAEQTPEHDTAARFAADDWFTPRRFALLLALLIAACYPGVLLGYESFFVRDYSGFGYPLAFYQHESFWQGARHAEIPLWNPMSYCGMPFLAQWNTMTFYPLSLIYLLFPMPWSLGFFCLAHMFLAGMGMYFLATRWTGNRLAGSLAGTVYAFSGLTVCALMWPNNIAAMGWMPWVVLAMERAWSEGGRHLILAALAGATQMLAGAPEAIALTWLVIGALAVLRFIKGEAPRLRIAATLAAVFAVVIGLSAAQLLPFADLLSHSDRDTGFSASQGSEEWAMPITGWANYLVPLFHTFRGPYGVHFQVNQYWTNSYFVGVGTIALALLGLVGAPRNARNWLLGAVTVIGLILALGDQGMLYLWLKRVAPVAGFMRFPIKFVLLATFLIPLLAAKGVNALRSLAENRRRAGVRVIAVAGVGVLAAIALIAWRGWVAPTAAEDRSLTLHNALVRGGFLVGILTIVAALPYVYRFKGQVLLRAGLLLLLWLDLFTHAPTPDPTVRAEVLTANSIRQSLHWDQQLLAGGSRIMQTEQSLARMTERTVGDYETDCLGRRLAQFADLNLLDDVQKVDGFFSLHVLQYHVLATRLYESTNALKGLKDFMGIEFTSNPNNPVDWVARDSFLPLITGGQAPQFPADDAALKALVSDDFDPRQTVYLPAEARDSVRATNRAGVRIVSKTFAAGRISAQVVAEAPALVVVAEAWYHPWRAYVDGKPARLWRANYAFQAVEVPAGPHEVRLVYEDHAFRLGTWISLVSLAICVVGWLLMGRSRGPQPGVTTSPSPS